MTEAGGRELIDRLNDAYTGTGRYLADDGTDNVRVVVRIPVVVIATAVVVGGERRKEQTARHHLPEGAQPLAAPLRRVSGDDG